MSVIDRETGRAVGSISAEELLAGRRRAVIRESERNSILQRERERALIHVAATPMLPHDQDGASKLFVEMMLGCANAPLTSEGESTGDHEGMIVSMEA